LAPEESKTKVRIQKRNQVRGDHYRLNKGKYYWSSGGSSKRNRGNEVSQGKFYREASL